ncbi:hypothetical protein PTKIN_Ptkin11bG0048200 [Pterospermum kingtungense]
MDKAPLLGDNFGNRTLKVCINLPPRVNSAGIWEDTSSPSAILKYSLPLLQLHIILIFFVTRIVYFFLKPLGIPLFTSQMLAGIILGPAILGRIDGIKAILFPPRFGLEIIDTASVFGFVIFLFLMGVKIDVKVAFKTTKSAKVIGIVSLLSPIIVGAILNKVFKKCPGNLHCIPYDLRGGKKFERLLETTFESITSLSVIAWLLSEIKIINSELGRLALSSAVVGDICSISLIMAISFYRYWIRSHMVAIIYTGAMVLFMILLLFVLRPFMFWIIRRTPEGKPVKDAYIFAIMLLAFGSALYTYRFQRSPLLGAFLFGLAVPDGPPLGSALVDKFECFASGVFVALYTTTCTMRADPRTILSSDKKNVKFSAYVVVMTFLAKFIACLIPQYWTTMPLNDSLAFALIMTSKGLVELSYFSTYKDLKIITDATFSIMTVGILVNSAIVPMLVRYLYDSVSRKYAGYQQRNIMHLKPNSELKILACVHRPENVAPFISLLNATCPTKESPNVVYALHLIELIGRDSPVFIDHQKQEHRVHSFFENFILAFYQYEQNNWGLVTVNAFTAISPANLMHEDVCTMALDKQTCLILLPFHRKWSIDGSVEVENNVIRNLNCSVLDRSPCSIAILVDRGSLDHRITRTSLKPSRQSYCIGMIFIGGKDDREALTLAKRMAKDPRVSLTVINLVDEDSREVIDWDTMLNAEVLKDIKRNEVGKGNIMYIEEAVKDGPQSALIVRSIAAAFDLIIVGRRRGVDSVQTSGLSEWSEFSELGIMGDLLASVDLDTRASVLIVQQQNYCRCT